MKVIVTGANGFIGSRLCLMLQERGHSAFALVRNNDDKLPRDSEGLRIERIHGDLLETKTIDALCEINADAVVHAAWKANGNYLQSPENLTHLSASLRLAHALYEAGTKRFMGIGTCFEYDLTKAQEPLKEDAAKAPAHLYSQCKLSLFETLSAFAKAHDDFEFSWPRLFFQYGPHEPHKRVVASVIRSLLKGEVAKTSKGTQRRDFLHVDDVALALCLCLEKDLRGAVNIGAQNAPAVREIVGEIARQLDAPERVDYGAFSPRPNDPACVCADTEKLRASTEFVPRFSLRDGISNAIAHTRSHTK